MSTLGKIFTVLIALVAVVIAAFVMTGSVLERNWKGKYEQAEMYAEKALEQRNLYEQKLADTKTELEALQAMFNNKKQSYDNTITELRDQIESQKTAYGKLEGELSALTASNEAQQETLAELETQRNTLEQKLTAVQGRNDELLAMISQLETRIEDLRARWAEAQETVRNLRVALDDAQGKLALMIEKTGMQPPEDVEAPPLQKVSGMVTEVDNDGRIAEINLGSDDGVVKGMEFYVYDPHTGQTGTYLATLVIDKVGNTTAAGQLKTVRGKVEVNDHVTNRFE